MANAAMLARIRFDDPHDRLRGFGDSCNDALEGG
jgi:hypothetical protein